MPHVHQSQVEAWGQKTPLHSRPGRPRTRPSTPPKNEPEVRQQQAPHVAEVPQQQAPHDDTDATDKHQIGTGEAEGPQTNTHDHTGAHTPDTALGPPSGMNPYATMTLPQHQL